MNLNQYGYIRERRKFGRQCLFTDRNELVYSIPQRTDIRKHYILKNPVTRSTQLGKLQGESKALTENVTIAHHGILHSEGGWPKDVNILDEEQTLRHRKKVEREDAWGTQVLYLSKITTDKILQNRAVNIYEDYYSEFEPMNIKSSFTARPVNVYHDASMPARPIITLDWCPGNLHQLLSVHTNTDHYPKNDDPNEFYIWDIENPLKVIKTFNGPTWTRKALYCPRDENLIAGGFTNGKVGIWDARTDGQCVGICPLEAAHREAVSALCWVHSKSNTEFYTGSVDGSINYWDGRNLKNWYSQYLLDPEKTDKQLRTRAHGCTSLEFEYTIPIRYMAGDDMGHIFVCNRKGTTPLETLILNYKLFSGPIRSIERNPFFVKNFLIVGDWCAKLWSEECKDFPLTVVFKKKVELLCGTWSTSRCSVFVTGDSVGNVDFWDLLLNYTKPIFTMNFKLPVTDLRFRKDGEFLAISLSNGDFFIIEMDTTLKQSGPKEKALLASLFERETYRSKLLQDRLEEIKLKATLAQEKEEAKEENVKGMIEEFGEEQKEIEPDEEGEEEFDKDPDPEFTEIRNNFLAAINLIRDKWKEREFISEPSPFEEEPNVFDIKSTSTSAGDDTKKRSSKGSRGSRGSRSSRKEKEEEDEYE